MYPHVWELGKTTATREKQRKPHGHWTQNGQGWTMYSQEWRWSQWRKSVDKGTENTDQSVISFIPKHHFPTPSHTLLWDPLLLDTQRPTYTLPRDCVAVWGLCRCAHVLAMPQQHCTTSIASLLWTRLWGFTEEQDQVSPSRNQRYGGANCKPTRRWMKEWGELVSFVQQRKTNQVLAGRVMRWAGLFELEELGTASPGRVHLKRVWNAEREWGSPEPRERALHAEGPLC